MKTANMTHQPASAPPGQTTSPWNLRPMRRLCGLAIAAIGLSAPFASAAVPIIVPVQNPSFETGSGTAPPVLNELTPTNWTKLTDWTFQGPDRGRVAMAGQFSNGATGSDYYLRYSWNNAGVVQDLNTTVSAGSTLSVTCDLGKDNAFGGGDVTGFAFFKVGTTYYYIPYDLSSQTKGVWQSHTFTTATPILNSGALSVGFRVANGGANNQYCCLDNVSSVTVTPSDVDPNAPTSTNATLAALENTATALAAGDFGYADPNSSPLAAVKITAVPTLGTLTYNGAPVVNGEIIAEADITKLSYLSPLHGFGAAYTTIGIAVQNSASPTGIWSLPAVMTVNVTHVNHAPTSTGGAVTMSVRSATSMTFAASNFQFSDTDAGNTLQAIKVTSLPTNGTLNVALDAEIPVADIGTLTYTPNAGYTGPDTFDFQVSDGTLFSANAIMAISVTTDILVQDGSFETPGANNMPGYWAGVAAPWTHSGGIWGQVNRAWGTSLPDNGGGTWVANFNDEGIVITQPLGSYSFNAGDTLSVSFDVGRLNNSGGIFEALFLINGVELLPQSFNNTTQAVNTWVTDTLTAIIPDAVTGELTLKFRWVSGHVGELEKVSNVSVEHVSVDPNAPTSTGATLAADENVPQALDAGNFGYANPANPASLLAAVQIIELPALGTLKNGVVTVLVTDLPLTVAAADIGNLSYLSPLGGVGTAYTTIGIKVQNSDTPTGLWSLPAEMTVNVTHVNHAPSSTGGAVILGVDTVKTFAAKDFHFADVDTGNTLHAIKVTSLPGPAKGSLKLGGTDVTVDTEVPAADIGTLTYTPNTGYVGADSFNFEVSDGALFSADATMAITVTSDILVQNGSFETHGAFNHATYWWDLGSPWIGGISPQGYEVLQVNQFDTFTAAADGLYAVNLEYWLVSVTQDLGATVNAGDTLSMTFSGGKSKAGLGGKFTASFVVGATEYTSSEFDTALQANDTWQSYSFSTPITNTGNLSIKFSYVSGNRPWLDNVSNVSVTPSGATISYADWALSNGVSGGVNGDSNHDGVQNGIAYFMGATGLATNPGPDAGGKVTWPMSATFSGTYEVQTSPDLETWTAVATQPTRNGDGNLVYTLTSGLGKEFVRLVVTPN
ncbi:MAG: Ig-like domain-containing protein [Verrucomicrobiota bacterium]